MATESRPDSQDDPLAELTAAVDHVSVRSWSPVGHWTYSRFSRKVLVLAQLMAGMSIVVGFLLIPYVIAVYLKEGFMVLLLLLGLSVQVVMNYAMIIVFSRLLDDRPAWRTRRAAAAGN